MPYTVFVSHATDDPSICVIRECRERVLPSQISFYLAEEDCQAGRSLREKIAEEIESRDAFVVLLTKMSAERPFVNGEIGMAFRSGKPIVPIVEKGMKRNDLLADCEHIELDTEKPLIAVERLAKRLLSLKSALDDDPRVLETDPETGSIVCPSTDLIRVVFNTEMDPKHRSFARTMDVRYPTLCGEPWWSDNGRTWTIPVSLEPNHTYEMWLNSKEHKGFKSVSGTPAEPYFLQFQTGNASEEYPEALGCENCDC